MAGIGNTQMYCLRAIATGSVSTARGVAQMRWPSSKQIDKKEQTVRKHMNRLVQSGYLRCIDHRYFLTDAGITAARNGSQQDRPLALRIAR